MRIKVPLAIIGGAALLTAGAIVYGRSSWETRTAALYKQLEAGRTATSPPVFAESELDGVPSPVQRYFRACLRAGQPIVTAARIEHAGIFNMSETAEQWKPFTSKQYVATRRPGFVWDARIAAMTGVPVFVHDAYVGGTGFLQARLFGLVRVAEVHDVPEIARGELMRFLAEAAWYPTALLPSQGVCWQAVDDTSAKASLTDGDVTATLLFRFNNDGLIESIRAEDRGRGIKKQFVPTPWEGRWHRYEWRDNMLVPIEGEVAWVFPAGPKPYWRGRITRIEYELDVHTRSPSTDASGEASPLSRNRGDHARASTSV